MSVAEVETVDVDAAVAAGLNTYTGSSEVAEEAFAVGVRYGWKKGYRQCARDTAAIGEVIPVFRRLSDVLEGIEV